MGACPMSNVGTPPSYILETSTFGTAFTGGGLSVKLQNAQKIMKSQREQSAGHECDVWRDDVQNGAYV